MKKYKKNCVTGQILMDLTVFAKYLISDNVTGEVEGTELLKVVSFTVSVPVSNAC